MHRVGSLANDLHAIAWHVCQVSAGNRLRLIYGRSLLKLVGWCSHFPPGNW